MVSRDALSRHHVDDDVDLLISVGGGGTVLSSAHVDCHERRTAGPRRRGLGPDARTSGWARVLERRRTTVLGRVMFCIS